MPTMEYISEKVKKLVKKFDTRDPFRICDQMNIHVHYKDLGTAMKAYYFYQSRIKNIIINSQTCTAVRRILCAHELGHAVLHSELATMRGFQELELFDTLNPTEYEANLFAAELMIEDNELFDLLNDPNKSFFIVAKELYVPAEILDFKFRLLKNKGYNLETPYLSQSNFLKNDFPGCFTK